MAKWLACECSDPGCPAEHGSEEHGVVSRDVSILYRIDMEDNTGTAMCDECAEDAFASGLFTTREDEEETEDE